MGSKLMRVSRDWGMIWIMEVLACLRACWVFTFTFHMHHSCKFVVLIRFICHFRGSVVKEEIGRKVSGTSGGQCCE